MHISEYIGAGTYTYVNDRLCVKNHSGEWEEYPESRGSISHVDRIEITDCYSASLKTTYFSILEGKVNFIVQSRIYLEENGIYIVQSDVNDISDKDIIIPFQDVIFNDQKYETYNNTTEIGVRIIDIGRVPQKIFSDVKFRIGGWVISSKYEDNDRMHSFNLR